MMEESLEEALRLKVKELKNTLTELKKQDFWLNAEKLKSNLPKRKRCSICTLKLPCKHFKALKDMPRLSIENLSPLLKSQEIDVSSYIPECDSENKKVSFVVNIRGRDKKIVIDPDVRTTSLPNEKRFNLLRTIEAYREEKLKEEEKKLEKARQEEAEKFKNKREAEALKKRYLSKQKEKLAQYKIDLNCRREELKNYVEEERLKKLEKEEKLKRYYENKKKMLNDYYEQKREKDTILIEDSGFALSY